MQLAVLPLTKKSWEAKVKMIDEVIDTDEMMQKIDEAGIICLVSYVCRSGKLHYVNTKISD